MEIMYAASALDLICPIIGRGCVDLEVRQGLVRGEAPHFAVGVAG